MPRCDTPAMNEHLAEISRAVETGAHAVLILDGAGWHIAGDLVVSDNITLLPLPSNAPELNPVETVWQFMRDNWLGEMIFASYEDILDQCCAVWNKLVAQPWKIIPSDCATGPIGYDPRRLV